MFRSSSNGTDDSVDAELRDAMVRLGILEELAGRLMLLMHVLDATATFQGSVQAVVVASDVHPVGKAVVALANQRGIPTIVVQNGLYGDAPDALTVGFLPVSARTVCVWGPGSAEILRRHGISPDRIRITGQPRFDRIVSLRGADWRPWVSAQLGIPERGPVLVFASQNIFSREEQHRALLKSFAEVLDTLPEATVVVKLHPAESPLLWQRVQRDVPRVHIVKEIDLHRLLAASDAVVTVFSTSGLEALLLGKPLIILSDLDRTTEMKYVEFGAALPADRSGLAAAVRAALYDPEARDRLRRGAQAFIEYYASAADGRATERVTEVIYEVAQTRGVR